MYWWPVLALLLGRKSDVLANVRHRAAIDALRKAVREIVAEATALQQQQQQANDGLFLRELLQAREAQKLSQEQLIQLALEMVIAGTDTSSVTMSYLPQVRVMHRQGLLFNTPCSAWRDVCPVTY